MRTRGERAAGVAALCTAVAISSASAQPAIPSSATTLTIPRVSSPPTLEDYLDGVPRPDESAVTMFVQREPGDGTPASQATAAYVSYDDKHLYVIVVARDTSPDQVRARLTKREAIGGDDAVGVVLDTFHDRRRAYIFLVNPLGIQLDGITTEGQDDDYSFDTLWRSEGRLTPFGFVVWIAIPFKSLRFPNEPAQTWGIAFGRIIPRANETSFWPYITRRVAGFGQQLATLTGLERVSPGRNVQLIPYGAYTAARFLETGETLYRTDRDGRVGLDAKLVLRDAFTLDAALNPDFSQVESDEPQVTINQRFEVFFPEKRPFFIENAAFFRTPIQLLFSRRIADPQFGGRLTGKTGRWAVGVLAADDRAPGARVPPDDPARGDRAGLVRVAREFAEQSSVGLFMSSLDFASSSNRLVALDSNLKLTKNWVAAGQAAFSRTTTLEAEHLEGPAFDLNVRRMSRGLFYSLNYRDLSPEFRAPLGFVPRVDIREISQFVERTWFPSKSRLVSYGPSLFALANWNHRDELQDWQGEAELDVELVGQTELEVSHEQSFERFQGLDFRKRETGVRAETAWLKWLELEGRYTRGRDINFFPSEGLAPFLGSSTSGEASVILRPTPRLRFDQTYLYSALRTIANEGPALTPGTNVFRNHILRSRVNYQFTRPLSLRAIVDYDTVRPNPALVDLDDTRQLTADFLLTYLVNPGTAIYVGYTDGYENLQLEPDESGVLRRAAAPLRSTGRQFFVKASYLFRFLIPSS